MIRRLNVNPTEYQKMRSQKPYRLTSSLAHVLVTESPAHAYVYLTDPERATKAQDKGSIFHELLLNKGKGFAVSDGFRTAKGEPSMNWQSAAAKEFKELALASGKIPMFKHELDEYRNAAQIIQAKIDHIMETQLQMEWTAGETEEAWEWEEDDIPCRCQFDWRFEATAIDLKFWNSVNPLVLPKKIYDQGTEIQQAVYTSCLERISSDYKDRGAFHLIVCEPEPPYAVSLVTIGPHMTAIGQQRFTQAKQIFAELGEPPWPTYPETVTVEADLWLMRKHEISVYETPTEIGGDIPAEAWNESEWF